MKLDEKDIKIIRILARNGRERVTKIAREINLSIDATNKRIKKMVENGIFDFGIYLYPQKIGYNITTNNLVKLRNFSQEEYDGLIRYLVKHPRVTTLLTLAGDYDLNIVIMAKNNDELEEIIRGIRTKFASIISDWKTLFVTKVNKFEEYEFFEK
jgi:Lrp/AsnC family transcriptional regulator for asnA, asnC and gidA